MAELPSYLRILVVTVLFPQPLSPWSSSQWKVMALLRVVGCKKSGGIREGGGGGAGL